jgi:hypothetical protein
MRRYDEAVETLNNVMPDPHRYTVKKEFFNWIPAFAGVTGLT